MQKKGQGMKVGTRKVRRGTSEKVARGKKGTNRPNR